MTLIAIYHYVGFGVSSGGRAELKSSVMYHAGLKICLSHSLSLNRYMSDTDYHIHPAVCLRPRKSINQSVNVLFYVCSHRGDIRQQQQHIYPSVLYVFRAMNF